MLYELANFEDFFGPLRLFRYLSFRCGIALALSFILAMAIAPQIIEYLRKLKYGDTQRTREQVGVLADLHAGKRNTPQMGGIIVYIGVMAGSVLFARPTLLVFVALFVYTALTALGFADDYLKIVKKSSKGISGKVKLGAQIAVSLAAVCMLYFSQEYGAAMRELWIPFLKYPLIASMPFWFMFVFAFFVIGGSSNALNLTDGVDGLAIGCTVTVALAYGIFSYISGNTIAAEYLFLRYIPQCGELTVVCCALLGASLAFLWYNAHPADIFMGDTGSLARRTHRRNRDYDTSARYARNRGGRFRDGGDVGNSAGRLVQTHEEKNFQDVANPPPLRNQGMGGDARGHKILDNVADIRARGACHAQTQIE